MNLGKILFEFASAEFIPTLIAHILVEAGIARFRLAARSNHESKAPRSVPQPRAVVAPPETKVVMVLSDLPGRVRLRVAGMRDDPTKAGVVLNALNALPGVRAVDVNPLTGSALLRYDPARLTLPEIQAALMPPGAKPGRVVEACPDGQSVGT